jgi:3-dehydroquinate synthetase
MHFVLLDPIDRNERMILNFGHTIAHALEMYTEHHLTHGIAVLWGMYFESMLSVTRDHLPFLDLERIQKLIVDHLGCTGSPLQLRSDEEVAVFMELLIKDKKTRTIGSTVGGSTSLPHSILLKEIGKIEMNQDQYTHPIAFEEVRLVMESLGWIDI